MIESRKRTRPGSISRPRAWAPLVGALVGLASVSIVRAGPPLAPASSAPTPSGEAAAERATIVVVASPGDRFGLRLVAELEALGHRAVVVDLGATAPSLPSMAQAARAAHATAAIRAVSTERGVEVMITDELGARTVVREIARDEGAASGDGALALRTVELLRASLLETARRPDPPVITPAFLEPHEATRVEGGGWPTTLRLGVSAAFLLSPGGFGPSASIDISLAYMPTDHFGVAAFLDIPISQPGLSTPAGNSALSPILGGGAVRIFYAGRSATWAPTTDAGVAVVSLSETGVRPGGLLADATSIVTAVPYVSVGLAFAATPNFRVRADVLVGLTTRRASFAYVPDQSASWGRPLVIPGLGVDFGLF